MVSRHAFVPGSVDQPLQRYVFWIVIKLASRTFRCFQQAFPRFSTSSRISIHGYNLGPAPRFNYPKKVTFSENSAWNKFLISQVTRLTSSMFFISVNTNYCYKANTLPKFNNENQGINCTDFLST